MIGREVRLAVCEILPLGPMVIFPETVNGWETVSVEALVPVPSVSDLHTAVELMLG